MAALSQGRLIADLFAMRNDESCAICACFRHHCSSVSAVVNPFRELNTDWPACLRRGASARSCSLHPRMQHCRAVVKVAFIGAGSIEFTRNVVTDLCSYPELGGELDLALHDVSAERLAHAQTLAARIAAQSGSGATVTASADRRPVLDGARYVLNEIQVG